jgi:chromosome segregation ATPase
MEVQNAEMTTKFSVQLDTERARIQILETALALQKEENGHQRAENERQRMEIERQNLKIERLEVQVAELRAENASLRDELRKKDARIENILQAFEDLKHKCNAVVTENAAKQYTIDRYDGVLESIQERHEQRLRAYELKREERERISDEKFRKDKEMYMKDLNERVADYVQQNFEKIYAERGRPKKNKGLLD